MCGVEQPPVIAIGTSERTFAVAEQLTFKQSFRERRAVLHDKGLGLARPGRVYGPGHHFLACAGLTLQQHGVRGVQDFTDQTTGLLHCRAGANQAVCASQGFVACGLWADVGLPTAQYA